MPSYMPDEYSMVSDNFAKDAARAASFKAATMAANDIMPPPLDDEESDDSSVSNMSALDEVRFSSVLQLNGCLPGNATDDEASLDEGMCSGMSGGHVKQMIFNDVWKGGSSNGNHMAETDEENDIVTVSSPSQLATGENLGNEFFSDNPSFTEYDDLYDEYPSMPDQTPERYIHSADDDFENKNRISDNNPSSESHSFTLELLKNRPSPFSPLVSERLLSPSPPTELQETMDEHDFMPVDGNNIT
mmetsp:Transcript_18240/g.27243  ORF Transcript_18240/g.27243 Transcript_18240/m.27243 type:complete len:245 (-) Transcript_18240:429-1163(-)